VTEPDLLVRNISDTALWAAAYRARESERPNALFRDPFARRLAGRRGEGIAEKLTFKDSWAWVTRTYLFDRYITAQVEGGNRQLALRQALKEQFFPRRAVLIRPSF
jgi:O-methyltransferase involved in polyketide biosynthesis